MNTLLQWGGHPVVHRLGWTLLHFLWQGAVVASLFALAQTALRKRSSNARYWMGCLALALMLAAPVITFLALGTERSVPVPVATGAYQARTPAPIEMVAGQGTAGQMGRVGQLGRGAHPRATFPPAPDPQSAIRNPQSEAGIRQIRNSLIPSSPPLFSPG